MLDTRQSRSGAPEGLEAFMHSLGALESGNNYDATGPYTGATYGRARGRFQIMEKIYPAWAREAGVDPNDYSPAAQDRVARFKMTQYYNRYGSWDLVAVAWFAGPGRADQAKKKGISSVGGMKDMLGTSVQGYVNKVVSGMGATKGDGTTKAGRDMPVNARQQRATTPMSRREQLPAGITRGLSTIAPLEAAPGTQLTEMQQATRDYQINQDSMGSILATVSEAAKGAGGQVLDLRSFLKMPSLQPQVVEGEAIETAQPPAPKDEGVSPTQADGPMAPPPKHDGFNGLTDSAKQGTQRLMGQFGGLRFTSGYRDPQRNTAAGGVKNSKHLTGQASDFVGTEEEMQAAAAAARAMGAKTLIHDSGSGRHLHIEWP